MGARYQCDENDDLVVAVSRTTWGDLTSLPSEEVLLFFSWIEIGEILQDRSLLAFLLF